MKRFRWLCLARRSIGLAVVMLAIGGCGRTHWASPDQSALMLPSPATTPDSTLPTTPGPIAPTTPAVADPMISASGSLLRPPATPTTIPAEQDCHQLITVPLASIGECATATSPSGTITGTDEGVAHSGYWDVWQREGNNADLVLTYYGNTQSTPGFVYHSADVANDGGTKLLAIEHTPGVDLVKAVDIIETSGVVVAHITVGASGGVVGPAPGGGIETWAATAAGTDTSRIIRYMSGAWRTVSSHSVPTSQVPAYPDDDGFGGGLP